MWRRRYIEKESGVGNSFASYGTLMHSILERFERGELAFESLQDVFEWEYPSAVPEPFPPNKFCDLRERYYQQGIDYLKSWNCALLLEGVEVLEVEKNFEIEINPVSGDPFLFNGIIDLVMRDGEGQIIIEDHKSKARFTSIGEQKKYARQLYLYSLHVKQEYGMWPVELRFNMFRSQNEVRIPFRMDGLKEAIAWAEKMVKEIRESWVYPPSPDGFFCSYLCNFREDCPYKEEAV